MIEAAGVRGDDSHRQSEALSAAILRRIRPLGGIMHAQLPRRIPFMAVVLVLMLAACQGKSIAGPDLGDTGPEVSPQVLVGQLPSLRCTSDQLVAVAPCQGEDVGSVCTPDDYAVIPWTGSGNTAAPEFNWTYPCIPDSFYVSVFYGADVENPSAHVTAPDPDADGLTFSWSPGAPLPWPAHLYHYSLQAWGQPPSEYGETYFWTGPFCTDAPSFTPYLESPVDEAVAVLQEQSTEGYNVGGHGFEWEYHDPAVNWRAEGCLTQFEGQVSADNTFATGVMPILTSSTMLETGGSVGGAVEWCHKYYWRVRAYTDSGQGPWSDTHSFKIASPEGWSACYSVSIEAVAAKNAACRVGPGIAYGILAYVPAGERHPIEGRNADGTWFKLQDLRCYIAEGLLGFEQGGTPFPGGADVGDLLSVLPDPPLPTVPPTEKAPGGPACYATLPTQAACEAAGGTWDSAKLRCKCP